MRGVMLVLLASCTYPVTNVVNEIIETDGGADVVSYTQDAALPDVNDTADSSRIVDASVPIDSAPQPITCAWPDWNVDPYTCAGTCKVTKLRCAAYNTQDGGVVTCDCNVDSGIAPSNCGSPGNETPTMRADRCSYNGVQNKVYTYCCP